MKNDYEIRGDVTAILWTNTKGKKFEILIDTDDLERVKAFPNTWYAHWNHRPKQYYAEGKRWDGRKRVCYSMHRWIMQPEGDDEVDHIYHDGLDNRRSNLRVIPKGANQQNYKSARVHSGTGIRGVYRTESKRWLARFRVTINIIMLVFLIRQKKLKLRLWRQGPSICLIHKKHSIRIVFPI